MPEGRVPAFPVCHGSIEMTTKAAAKPLREALSKLSTSTLSDALDRFGIAAGCLGIQPMVPGTRMAGPAFTVRYVPLGSEKGTVGDYIDDVEPGSVVVLDNNGRTDCTVWGDILTVTAKQRGVAGTVIDGVCRDMPTILRERYPIFSRGRFMMTGKDRVMVHAYNVPVSIGDRQVCPGDLVVGDDSGVVVIPRAQAESVLAVATQIDEAEAHIVQAVRGGVSLRDARQQFKYHQLQTKAQ